MQPTIDLPTLMPSLLPLLASVSAMVREFSQQKPKVQHKLDGSPVSEADLLAHTQLTQGLQALGFGIPVVSEEALIENVGDEDSYWLIDPIDGTRAFLRGEPYYVVNVALIHKKKAIFGAISAPAFRKIYYGAAGQGAWVVDEENLAHASERVLQGLTEGQGWRVLTSSRTVSAPFADWLAHHPVLTQTNIPSAYKFCLILDGQADVYARRGTVNSWDIAAGHALMEAAGGRMMTAKGEPLLYSVIQPEVKGFVASVPGVVFHSAPW